MRPSHLPEQRPPTIPEHSRAPRRRSRLPGCVALLVGLCLLLTLVGAGYSFWRSAQTVSLPRVLIAKPTDGATIAVNYTTLVVANATDPDGIARVEFWINGKLAGTQLNPKPAERAPFSASQVWRPTGEAAYTIFVRAIDTQGYAGDASLIAVQARPVIVEPPFDPTTQVIVSPGENLDLLAEKYHTTAAEIRRRNPALGNGEPQPGDAIVVPFSPDTANPDDSADAPSDAPSIEPPPASPPPPPPGDAPAAEPDEPLAPFGDLGARTLCSFMSPGTPGCPSTDGTALDALAPYGAPSASPFCSFAPPDTFGCPPLPRAGETPPRAPYALRAELTSDCQVNVTWADDSAGGARFVVFRIYRGLQRISTTLTNASGSAYLGFMDEHPPVGTVSYAVLAENAAGGSVSEPSNPVTIGAACARVSGEVESVEWELVAAETTERFERLYCYASLAGLPFERVPDSPGQFITLADSHWDSASAPLEGTRVTLIAPRTSGLEMAAECLGWRTGALLPESLGLLRQTHHHSEWHDAPLIVEAASDTGGLRVQYKIQHYLITREGPPSAQHALIDPTVPRPTRLRRSDWWDDPNTGRRVNAPGLGWTFFVPFGFERPLQGFNVEAEIVGSAPPPLEAQVPIAINTVPLVRPPRTDCPRVIYRVQTLLAEVDPATGQPIGSPWSEPLEISDCPIPMIVELLDVTTGNDLCDADPCFLDESVNSYGSMLFAPSDGVHPGAEGDATIIQWNSSCGTEPPIEAILSDVLFPPVLIVNAFFSSTGTICGAARLATDLDEGETARFANEYLSIRQAPSVIPAGGAGPLASFSQNNNLFVYPMLAGEGLDFFFAFYERDPGPDDIWCIGLLRIPPRTEAEWDLTDETFTVSGSGADGSCAVRFHLRPNPRF
ncbi:MAG: hypothetical protein HY741_27210 [Chloroflexi bacterium]|nr:hypothetical protein [Chloroflexota bacterium]